MIKGVTHAYLGIIWYHSETSPYSQNQFLALDFFGRFFTEDSSTSKNIYSILYCLSWNSTILATLMVSIL